jgi:hypothetical protein
VEVAVARAVDEDLRPVTEVAAVTAVVVEAPAVLDGVTEAGQLKTVAE